MFKIHYGKCTECKRDSIIVVKKGYCKLCNERSKGKSTTNGIRKSFGETEKKAHRPTGELRVFNEIWAERKHFCQCCGKSLGDNPKPIFFSHILSKGAYSVYRLLKLNIMLKCELCHHEWEFGDKSQDKFKLARMIAEKLKRMYYGSDSANDIDPSVNNTGS